MRLLQLAVLFGLLLFLSGTADAQICTFTPSSVSIPSEGGSATITYPVYGDSTGLPCNANMHFVSSACVPSTVACNLLSSCYAAGNDPNNPLGGLVQCNASANGSCAANVSVWGSQTPGGLITVTVAGIGGPSCEPPPPPSYTVTLSGLEPVQPSPPALAAPDNTLAITATVTDSNGNHVPGVSVHLALSVLHASGGHQHGDDTSLLRTGTFSDGTAAYDVTTLYTGSATTTYYAPSVSGTVLIAATCESVTCTQAGPNAINVMVAGLGSLPPSPDFILVGGGLAVPAHPDNHYLTPQALLKAKELAHLWHTLYRGIPVLAFNDASLVWGGTFDIDCLECQALANNKGGDWVGPHAEHRAGVVIDVRANGDPTAIPPLFFMQFVHYVTQVTGRAPLPETNHFHVRLLGVAQ